MTPIDMTGPVVPNELIGAWPWTPSAYVDEPADTRLRFWIYVPRSRKDECHAMIRAFESFSAHVWDAFLRDVKAWKEAGDEAAPAPQNPEAEFFRRLYAAIAPWLVGIHVRGQTYALTEATVRDALDRYVPPREEGVKVLSELRVAIANGYYDTDLPPKS